MTKEQALHKFFNDFLTAYEENSVPDDATYPYSTYTLQTDSWNNSVPISYNIFYRDSSWTEINQKANQFADLLTIGGVMINCDEGALWIKRGHPFMQSMGDPNDDMVKRKYINVTVDYLTV